MASVSEANTNFCLDLFKKFSDAKPTGNVFYSPFSISSALGMVYLGAAGNTATQMSQCLHVNKTKDDVHDGFNKLMSELNKQGAPFSLSLANRLYGEESYQFVETFLGATRKYYHAELETVDFISNAEVARVKINTWVENQTQEKIKNLLAEGVVNNFTRLVLVNAIYFKASWDKKFLGVDTREAKFKLSKKSSKQVQMMTQTSNFPLASIPEVNSQILELPYKGNDLSMFIILPNQIEDNTTGLEKLEKKLIYSNLLEWTRPEKMKTVLMQVDIPKFKLEETYDMEQALKSLGMVDAFDLGRSDFSGMSPNNDLVLSKAVHKAFVEVNEEGTEAAAATGMVFSVDCLIVPGFKFIADHPFLFFIRHNPTKSILFCGRCSNP